MIMHGLQIDGMEIGPIGICKEQKKGADLSPPLPLSAIRKDQTEANAVKVAAVLSALSA